MVLDVHFGVSRLSLFPFVELILTEQDEILAIAGVAASVEAVPLPPGHHSLRLTSRDSDEQERYAQDLSIDIPAFTWIQITVTARGGHVINRRNPGFDITIA